MDAAKTTIGRDGFGSGRLFFADSRLAFALLNYGRHWALKRVFGVSREQHNLLTFVLLLGGADVAYLGARRVASAPLAFNMGDATFGGLALREAALGLGGPAVRDVPGVGPLLAFAVIGGAALPGLRRAARRMRTVEQHVREERIRRYRAAMRPVGAAPVSPRSR